MNTQDAFHLTRLVERQLDGSITEEELRELEAHLLESAEARALYLDLTHQHALLGELGDSLVQEELHRSGSSRFWRTWPLPLSLAAAVAAMIWFSVSWRLFSGEGPGPVVATLVASDHASWESPLPTTPNAALTAGFMKLLSGVATIRFESGVEVILEAPAHLVLEDPMKGRLVYGSAVIEVPEEGIGFVMETPDSYAVDHGTVFAVSVSPESSASSFEVLSGEISVHHRDSGEVHRLQDRESVSATSAGLSDIHLASSEAGELPALARSIRISTGGREQSIIRGDDLGEHLHPDFLMVKHGTFVEDFDRRSVICFTLPRVEIREATLRLNLVPCGLGFASRLPATSTFAIYGFSDGAFKWDPGLSWAGAPRPEDGTPVLRFDLSRGLRDHHLALSSPELIRFLSDHRGEDVTFLLVRETDEAEGNGLVHAFASSLHPSAAGPTLELISNP